MSAIIGVVPVGAVGQGDARQLADAVVAESRRFAVDTARSEPAARVIAQGGEDAVGIDDRERAAVAVVA
jgi:hypothetical protein